MNSNEYMARYVADRYLRLKIKAIDHKGGKCLSCGYDKCYAALEFHHRDPTTKEFSWSDMRTKSWDAILAELEKCDLLCSNCHKETHHNDGLLKMAELRARIRAESKPPPRQYGICVKCGNKTLNKYCSQACQWKAQEKIKWPDDLKELVAASSMLAVARVLGVTDNAVKKRLKTRHT